MNLSDIAQRFLKEPGYSKSLSNRGIHAGPHLSSALVGIPLSVPTPPKLTHPPLAGPGGMISNNFGESRSNSIASVWARSRPLSDIRELTEPSLADTVPRMLLADSLSRNTPRSEASQRPSATPRHRPSIDMCREENREPDRQHGADSNVQRSTYRGRPSRTSSRTPSPPNHTEQNHSASSIYSIPPTSVPPRSSSHNRIRNASQIRPLPPLPSKLPLPAVQHPPATTALSTIPAISQPPTSDNSKTVPPRGQSQSPLRHVAARLDPVAHDINRSRPSRTFVREPLSKELLEFPSHRHPRIELGLDLSASIFVGGGSIEGTVQICVDDAERIRHKRTLDISRISIDLLGLEEMNGNRRCVFLNLATELIDEDNPPPQNMVDTREPIGSHDLFWHLMPSVTNLAFNLNLPLNVGPPPFHSKNARIRYMLCVSLLIRDQGRQYIVRTSEDIVVLSVYDPEKALMSLPSPLTAADEWVKARDATVEVVRVTAGLHRQVWVSGTSIYVDVHIANNSRKTIKKIELQLERDILCYKHAAASTMEKSAGQARIFDSNDRSILSKAITKHGSAGWHGVSAHQTHIRTCDLEVPRGHATVKCGKYFEVRYFLNVVVSSSHTKLVAVQLPIVLIHMNSLDVVPNSVEQVALAIEEKRHRINPHLPSHLTRRPSRSVQGRAFAAPRMQSLERMRARVDDLNELGEILDHSPRKHGAACSLRRANSNWDYRTPPSNRKGRVLGDGEAADLQSQLRRVHSGDTVDSSSKHNQSRTSTQTVRRGTSTRSRRGAASALGFREAEVREDMELAGLGLGITAEAPFKQRLELSRERQYRFSKKKSSERWKGVANVGVGWLRGSSVGGKDEREKDGWV